MAAGHSDYHRGEMPVQAQASTFKGFMDFTVYGGALLALIVLMPVLVFGVNLSWPVSLLITLVFGVILGIALKLKAQWYASIVALGIFTAIVCALIAAFM